MSSTYTLSLSEDCHLTLRSNIWRIFCNKILKNGCTLSFFCFLTVNIVDRVTQRRGVCYTTLSNQCNGILKNRLTPFFHGRCEANICDFKLGTMGTGVPFFIASRNGRTSYIVFVHICRNSANASVEFYMSQSCVIYCSYSLALSYVNRIRNSWNGMKNVNDFLTDYKKGVTDKRISHFFKPHLNQKSPCTLSTRATEFTPRNYP